MTLGVRSVAVGRRTVVVVTVRDQRGKRMRGVAVTARGPGIKVTARTNRKGVVRFRLRPRSPGILSLKVPGKSACTRRVGIVGAFEPPVTG
jgi:hypothetical protein